MKFCRLALLGFMLLPLMANAKGAHNPCPEKDPCVQVSIEEFGGYTWVGTKERSKQVVVKNIPLDLEVRVKSSSTDREYVYTPKESERKISKAHVVLVESLKIEPSPKGPRLKSEYRAGLAKSSGLKGQIWSTNSMEGHNHYNNYELRKRLNQTLNAVQVTHDETYSKGDKSYTLARRSTVHFLRELDQIPIGPVGSVKGGADLGVTGQVEIRVAGDKYRFAGDEKDRYDDLYLSNNQFHVRAAVTQAIGRQLQRFLDDFAPSKTGGSGLIYFMNLHQTKLYVAVGKKQYITFARVEEEDHSILVKPLKEDLKEELEVSLAHLKEQKTEMLDDVFDTTYGTIVVYLKKSIDLIIKLLSNPEDSPDEKAYLRQTLHLEPEIIQNFEIIYFLIKYVKNEEIAKDKKVDLYKEITLNFLKHIDHIDKLYFNRDIAKGQGSQILQYFGETLVSVLGGIISSTTYQNYKARPERSETEQSSDAVSVSADYFDPLETLYELGHELEIRTPLSGQSNTVIQAAAAIVSYYKGSEKIPGHREQIIAPLRDLGKVKVIKDLDTIIDTIEELVVDTEFIIVLPEEIQAPEESETQTEIDPSRPWRIPDEYRSGMDARDALFEQERKKEFEKQVRARALIEAAKKLGATDEVWSQVQLEVNPEQP